MLGWRTSSIRFEGASLPLRYRANPTAFEPSLPISSPVWTPRHSVSNSTRTAVFDPSATNPPPKWTVTSPPAVPPSNPSGNDRLSPALCTVNEGALVALSRVSPVRNPCPDLLPSLPAATIRRHSGGTAARASSVIGKKASPNRTCVSRPIRSNRVQGPIRYPSPDLIAVSMSSGVANPASIARITSLLNGTSSAFRMKPGLSCVSTEKFGLRLRSKPRRFGRSRQRC